MMDALLLFKAFVMFSNQGTISSLLELYMEKGSISVLKVISYVTPWSHGYRDVTATHIRRVEIPSHTHVSISIGRNQSMKVCGVYTFQ